MTVILSLGPTKKRNLHFFPVAQDVFDLPRLFVHIQKSLLQTFMQKEWLLSIPYKVEMTFLSDEEHKQGENKQLSIITFQLLKLSFRTDHSLH